MSGDVAALVVTHNRKELLARCLAALEKQTLLPSRVIVVDNASEDGTRELLAGLGDPSERRIMCFFLQENTGGAGGFHVGLEAASRQSVGWVWLMDDDAVPEPEALETLVRAATNRNNVYASVACDGDRLSWAMTLAGTGNSASQGSGLRIRSFGALPAHPEVEFAPFLGFLVHTDLVKRIGLPEAGYFVAADDVEYCLRARKHGSRIILVPQSRLCHPVSDSHSVNLFGTEIICLKLPPWKRYYDTRNRLLLARKHYGAAFYYKTIPATFVRLVAVIWREPRRIAQCHAFVAGFVDGLLGKRGCRHSMWQIAQ